MQRCRAHHTITTQFHVSLARACRSRRLYATTISSDASSARLIRAPLQNLVVISKRSHRSCRFQALFRPLGSASMVTPSCSGSTIALHHDLPSCPFARSTGRKPLKRHSGIRTKRLCSVQTKHRNTVTSFWSLVPRLCFYQAGTR